MITDPADLEQMVQYARSVCAKYGIKSHIVLSAQGSSLGTMVRKRLIADFLSFGCSAQDITDIIGYDSVATTNLHIRLMDLHGDNPKIPPMWPATPQDLIDRLGGWPPPGGKRNRDQRQKVVRTVLKECPGLTCKQLGRILGIDHSCILRYAKDEQREKAAARAYRYYQENKERVNQNKARLREKRKELRERILAIVSGDASDADLDRYSRKHRQNRRRRLEDNVAKLARREAKQRLASLAGPTDLQ